MISSIQKDILRLVVIGGVRPHYIKCAALKMAIDTYNKLDNNILVDAQFINAGQHYDDELAGSLIK